MWSAWTGRAERVHDGQPPLRWRRAWLALGWLLLGLVVLASLLPQVPNLALSGIDKLEHALAYLDAEGREIHWAFIRAALASVADTAVVPLQDVLGLGSEARMNLPGRGSGNWGWRYAQADLRDEDAARLRELAELFGRLPRPEAAAAEKAPAP